MGLGLLIRERTFKATAYDYNYYYCFFLPDSRARVTDRVQKGEEQNRAVKSQAFLKTFKHELCLYTFIWYRCCRFEWLSLSSVRGLVCEFNSQSKSKSCNVNVVNRKIKQRQLVT